MVKIKKAKDINGESFYFASHAQATFLDDGSTVQDQIEQIKEITDNYVSPDLSNCVTPQQLAESLNSKQDVISDLEIIRKGAVMGKTALQRKDLASIAFSNNYSDLGNTPHIPTADDIEQWGFINQDNLTNIIDDIKVESMVSITYSELKSLRDNGNLIPGQKYRIIDYVTYTNESNTKSAGHAFDIIVEALDEKTLSEKAKAIHNKNNDYFSTEKLEAWDLWYCLDNDSTRFGWVIDSEDKIYDSSECVIDPTLIEGNTFKTPFAFSGYMWNDPVNGSHYESKIANDLVYEWGFEEEPNGSKSLYLLKSDIDIYNDEGTVDNMDRFYYRGVVEIDGTEYDYWQKYELMQPSYVINSVGTHFALTKRIVEGDIIEYIATTKKGVIYRMIDEHGNDCPYDFKNIMFKKHNAEELNDDTYYFTFSYLAGNDVVDASVFCNNWSIGTEEMRTVYSNTINKCVINGIYQLPRNIFISINYDEGLYGCNHNKLGYNCTNNIFSYGCCNNIFDNECTSNEFGIECQNNNFKANCSYNIFGNYCSGNSFGDNYRNNKFGDDCSNNSFGNDCSNNTFGNECVDNILGNLCNNNLFDNECCRNSFGNECISNSFGIGYYSNTFGNYCQANIFGDNCQNNLFGNNCSSNSFGNNCRSNTLKSNCALNIFGDDCVGNILGYACGADGANTFGNNSNCNIFGNWCNYNKIGENCNHNIFGINCWSNTLNNHCLNNIFGNECNCNTFIEDFYFYNNNLSERCSYNNIRGQSSSDRPIQNLFISKGISGTHDELNEILISDSLLGADYEIKVAKNSSGELKIYCEADLIA